MEVGFIGLGNMGTPMATRLISAGHRLTVFDASPASLNQIASKGARVVNSAKEVGDSVETVFLSLPTPAIVKEVCLTPETGLINGTKVKRVVDCSTTGSKTATEVGEALAANGIQLVDSPVSGGVSGAVSGSLAVMVSCPQPHFDLLKPLLEQIGKVFYVGSKLGLAQTMKLANNYLSATALAATSEAVAMGVKAGLDPQTMIEVINSGSGRNSASQDKFPRSVLTGTFDFGFTSGLMMKDLVLCAEEAERVGMEMPVFDSVNEAWKAVITSQGAGSDFTAIAKHVEDKAGVKIRK